MRNFFWRLIGIGIFFCGINAKIEVFFAPQDRPTRKLIEVLNGANQRIFAAVYTLTDKKIVQALIQAKNRNVDVQLVLDKFSFESPWSKASDLADAGIKIMLRSNQIPALPSTPNLELKTTSSENVLNVEESSFEQKKNNDTPEASFDGLDEEFVEALQPEAEVSATQKKRNFNREALMHNKYAIIDNQVWTGSLNWTISASSRNQENSLLISGESEVVEKFLKNFNELTTKSSVIDKSVINSMRREPPRSWRPKPQPAPVALPVSLPQPSTNA